MKRYLILLLSILISFVFLYNADTKLNYHKGLKIGVILAGSGIQDGS